MRAPAPAKINLALVVGPVREDGKHELVTVYQRVGLADTIDLEPAGRLEVSGFAGDSLVRDGLELLAARAAVGPLWRVVIEKRVPVAAGLGGGSSDAATALRLANATLDEPLPNSELHGLAERLGADVPFFLADGPSLGTGTGSTLTALELPQDYWVVLLLPSDARKASTGDVYRAFDEREGPSGWEERRDAVLDVIRRVRRPRDLAALPPNDLASSPVSQQLRALGAFRADVSGAGPVVYGLFHHRQPARAAARALGHLGRTWITAPAWYG